ncbi:MAG: hypothetical protein A3F84_17365 [Candidatus Handelsmanbacteria bacterium RIFCSPLOWO2_12_FULL_64_10]|uniref:Uncharacterized protein n=1 Tax=Handelsmanbacteria sp. (strain RIFCSPLOWO2_12_FULL_64_10) TaxID=1817868 RepID=A0A1F6CAM0_HANXR|nr:MAG: hypothetical protein A3F84_17365 [Candidatus Handelsmanbacteria bacterium RIFCSPLOWO2_12_FULL_64_10]
MIYRGIAKGKTIELETLLPYPEGQPIRVSVEPLTAQSRSGSPVAIRQAMHEPPHLSSGEVDELEQAIELGKLPVRQEGVFEKGK